MSREAPSESNVPPPPREMLAAAGWLARGVWFVLGVTVGVGGTLVISRLNRAPTPPASARSNSFEALPLADNSGVCQEFVAIASLRTTYSDAMSTAQRIAPSLPSPLRPEHLRVVRAIAPGEHWTLALDNQPGAGTLEQAGVVAGLGNAMPGTGIRWSPIFYGARELFDAAGVLCMPRQAAGSDAGR
ncbi:MAG: hypothetical protein U0269_09590 [Polyangiales bacterium]